MSTDEPWNPFGIKDEQQVEIEGIHVKTCVVLMGNLASRLKAHVWRAMGNILQISSSNEMRRPTWTIFFWIIFDEQKIFSVKLLSFHPLLQL